jgi:hypothetical protein
VARNHDVERSEPLDSKARQRSGGIGIGQVGLDVVKATIGFGEVCGHEVDGRLNSASVSTPRLVGIVQMPARCEH